MTYEVIESKTINGARIEVIGYGALAGSSDARTAEQLFFLREARMQLKSIRIQLNRGKCRMEPGALYHMSGELTMKATTAGGVFQAIKRAATSGDSVFVNEITGKGEIFLEPTFGHFILVEISDDDSIIVDKGMFYAAAGDISISSIMNRGTGMVAGEGLFQTQLSGNGVVALFSPVPMSEISEIQVTPNSPLYVDGNFALMRTSGVSFRLTKSSKSWFSTSISGEGLLQHFTGNGSVWIAPTQKVYEQLSTPDGLSLLSLPPANKSNMMGARRGR